MIKKLFELIKERSRRKRIKKEGGVLYSSTARDIAKSHNVEIGLYSYGSCFNKNFVISGKCRIGRYCSIADDVHYLGGNHPTEAVSSSAIFYNKGFSGFDVKDICREELVIGNDVWIGYGALITAKCHSIGNGAVIGAGSVVTKDVPPYAVVAGNPARIIRYRFDAETIKEIEDSKWWDFNPSQIIKYYEYMNNPKLFVEMFRKHEYEKE